MLLHKQAAVCFKIFFRISHAFLSGVSSFVFARIWWTLPLAMYKYRYICTFPDQSFRQISCKQITDLHLSTDSPINSENNWWIFRQYNQGRAFSLWHFIKTIVNVFLNYSHIEKWARWKQISYLVVDMNQSLRMNGWNKYNVTYYLLL